MNKIQKLKEKFNQLASSDKHGDVLGSEVHRYQLNPCISEAKLQAFEQKYQMTLPGDYRNFLLSIGNGGAGPGYGLFGIGYQSEMTRILQQEGEDFLCQIFPGDDLLDEDDDDFEDEDEDFEDEDIDSENYLIQGTIPIAHYGTGIYAQLVITGNQRGNVWISDRANEGEIYPASPNFCCMFHGEDDDCDSEEEDRALSFYQWYDDWLDKSLALIDPDLT